MNSNSDIPEELNNLLDEDTLIDASDPNFIEKLKFAFVAVEGSSAYSNKRDRPYTGQSHTSDGERGKTLIEGLTMRDLQDCFVIGLLRASGIPELYSKAISNTWLKKDVYDIPMDIDPIAACQNMLCEVEKMMGIYPNTPEVLT